jgi:hypothetical protein
MRIPGTLLGLSALLLLSACGGEQLPQDNLKVDPATDSTQEARARKTRNIFHNIPSPMETAALLKKAGAEYDKDILNDVKKVDNYMAASEQALNLGIYGADLSYASVYNNTQESMLYTSCVQKLAKKLDVSNAFNEEVVGRMEKNRNERDSLLNIISEAYWNVDAYLKENQRDHISALMMAGGWLEGLYIATRVTSMHDTPELRQRIAEQKLPLKDLIELIATYSTDDPAVANVLTDLKALEGLFAEVVSPGGASTVTQENGVTVIGGTAPTAALTDAQLKALSEKTASVRDAYVN